VSHGQAVKGALLYAAPTLTTYRQFAEVPVPAGSAALSAWTGAIQPFSSDDSARGFLRDATAGKQIWIHAGSIRDSVPRGGHWADAYLLDMARPCTTLMLVMPPPAHPRAYLLRPKFPEYYSWMHPHPRFDQTVEWDKGRIPGLCVYSAAEFEYDASCDRTQEFLDQLTIFLGKHLIWLRTRQLYRGFPPVGILMSKRAPGEPLFDDAPILVRRALGPGSRPIMDYWAGLWPGPIAAGRDPATHLRTIQPNCECWCGTGVEYDKCHRTRDQGTVRANR
jgi:hypothetical protein